MNFLRLKHFLELINDYRKRKNTEVTRGNTRACHVASPGGSVLLMSALTKSMLTVDQSTGSVGSASQWGPTGQSLSSDLQVGPACQVKPEKKEKGLGVYWAGSGSGGPTRLGLGSWVGSGIGSQAGSARLLDWAFGHWRPTSISSSSFLLFSSPASSP